MQFRSQLIRKGLRRPPGKQRISPLPIAMVIATIATITDTIANTGNPEKCPLRVASTTKRVTKEYPAIPVRAQAI